MAHIGEKQDFAHGNLTPTSNNEAIDPKIATTDIQIGHRATNISLGEAAHLPQAHRDYLISRHGTLDLDPIPSADPADPYNWPEWKKLANLTCVAFHAMMTTFIAAAIIPAYETMAEEFETSITRASYLTSLQIAILGYAPLFWKPISNRYGRRPVWLISTLGSLLFNVGCALSHSYATMAVCRAFTAFFISPPGAIGSGVVTETYFKRQRGQFMGVWTLLVTLGPPLGPFVMGFVVTQTGNYRWIYWVLAIVNGLQFIFALFLQPETRYVRKGVQHTGSAFKQEYLTFGRLDPNPLKMYEFIQPLSLFKYPSIVIPTIAYSIVFGFCSVLLTVEIPQLFVPKFGFNAQQLGLQFLGIIIGSIIGEQIGGRLSDFWMNHKAKQMGYRSPPPEHRLWLSYVGFVLGMVGVIVFGVRFQQLPQGHWDVTPIVGIAIAAVGNQIIATVSTTYAVDCHLEHSASIGTFINVVRSTWAFVGPFWYPDMLEALGAAGSGGLMAGLIFLCAVLPVVVLQWKGRQWRRKRISSPRPEAVEKEAVVKDEETGEGRNSSWSRSTNCKVLLPDCQQSQMSSTECKTALLVTSIDQDAFNSTALLETIVRLRPRPDHLSKADAVLPTPDHLTAYITPYHLSPALAGGSTVPHSGTDPPVPTRTSSPSSPPLSDLFYSLSLPTHHTPSSSNPLPSLRNLFMHLTFLIRPSTFSH